MLANIWVRASFWIKQGVDHQVRAFRDLRTFVSVASAVLSKTCHLNFFVLKRHFAAIIAQHDVAVTETRDRQNLHPAKSAGRAHKSEIHQMRSGIPGAGG